jgi:adenosylcobinamide kinase/adenosylcobinamide-phosphate guanylyltransferase
VITLILGGARSGKSAVAERLAGRAEGAGLSVTYVATLEIGDDGDLAERVAHHRQRRPATWHTVEAGFDLPELLASIEGTLLLDSLGPYLARHANLDVDGEKLCHALQTRTGDSIVVSEEVGLGVHPSSEIGRQFRDALGTLNQSVAEVADEVLLVVAGRVLRLVETNDG